MRVSRLLLFAALPLAIVLTLIGCNARGLSQYAIEKQPEMDISSMRSEIRVDLQKQMRHDLDDKSIRVVDVSCLQKSKTEAKCLAEVSDSSFNHTHIPIHVDVDPKNGPMIWETDH
jgi:hypothetical protein